MMMMLTVMMEGKSSVKVHGMYTTNARPVLKMGQEKKSHKAVIINIYGWGGGGGREREIGSHTSMQKRKH